MSTTLLLVNVESDREYPIAVSPSLAALKNKANELFAIGTDLNWERRVGNVHRAEQPTGRVLYIKEVPLV